MEIFYSNDISGDIVRLNSEESAHCVRVLRHREGDEIAVMDGAGTLLWCVLFLQLLGEMPYTFLKALEKWSWLGYPIAAPILPME